MDASRTSKKIARKVPTLLLVLVAVIALLALYNRWTQKPWTRDGQVRADVVKVAPRVTGYVVDVAVENNQFVKKGDLLFQIDPSSFRLTVANARVELDQAREEVAALNAAVHAAEAAVEEARAGVTVAGGQIAAAQSAASSADAAIQGAESGVTSARALIQQWEAELDLAQAEFDRAQRLVEQKAGSVEDAEIQAASLRSSKAQLNSAKAKLGEAEAKVAQAVAGKGEAQANLLIAENSQKRAEAELSSADAKLQQAKANLGEPGEANVRIRSAKVELEETELDLSWTSVYAPCDGYVTNLYVREGAYGVAGTPLVAFVDSGSFRVHGYFQESKLRHIKPGDRAVVTLMSYPDKPLEGIVNTIGNAVNPPNIASTEGELGVVPEIEPTFDWVRLPQRVPVSIRLTNIPQDVRLISGTTASVAIHPSR